MPVAGRQAVAVVIGIAIDQVNDRAADAADRRDPQFHRAGFDRDRLGPAPDIANVVAFVCSEQAATLTGESISVAGGGTKAVFY